MLTIKQLKEIRGFLEKAQKPLFIFDNDADGLTSYLLLKKKYQKGERLCLKASPKTEGVVISAAIHRHKPDLVVFLDIATLEEEITDNIRAPIVWIDHHPPIKREHVNYYNPRNGKRPDRKPTSYWSYQVVDENEWLAIIGITADWFVPDNKILKKFKYKKLLGKTKNKKPPQLMFDTEYGKLIKVLYFCIKGTNDEMNESIDALEKIKDPLEILKQTTANGKLLYKRYEKINKEYEKILNEALTHDNENVIVCTYPDKGRSFRSILSNELLYRLKCKALIIATEKEHEVIMSLRSKGSTPIAPILKKALKKFRGYGGGHEHACGGGIIKEDFPKFLEMLKKEYN